MERQGTLTSMAGTVEGIHISSEFERLPEPVDAVEVTAEGVRGDRYFGERNLTLIEAEALEGLFEDTGIELTAAESRRQILTRDVRLNDLAGKRFRVGEVECVGEEWCEPCSHLQGLTKPGVLRGLVHRGGLRADIVRGGRISVGDRVEEAGWRS
jgi:MOSC domain-containing protein YiiM